VQTKGFAHNLVGGDAQWDGLLEGTVRVRAAVRSHPEDVQHRIRAAFDRKVGAYPGPDGGDIPVSVKIASARRPRGAPART
jgi:hypothetical protein